MRKTLRFLFWGTLVGAAVTVAAGVYILTMGIPQPVVRHYLRRVENTQGVQITVDRVRWAPWHHITAEGVQLSMPGTGTSVGFRTLVVSVVAEEQDKKTVRPIRCRFSGGHVELAKKGQQAPESIRLVAGDAFIDPEHCSRVSASGMIGERWRFSVNGTFKHARDKDSTVPRTILGESILALRDKTYQALAAFAKTREERFLPETLNARVLFDIDVGDARKNRAWAFIDGGPVRVGNVALDPCSAALRWTDGRVRIDSLNAQASDYDLTLQGNGSVSPTTWDASATLRVQAQPAVLAATGLLPTNYLDKVALLAPLDVYLDVAGSLPTPSTITGRIICDAAEYRGLRLDQLAVTFRGQSNEWEILDATAALHGEGPARSAKARGTLSPGGAYRIHMETDAEPQRLASLLPTNIASLAASCTVHGYSRVEATLSRDSTVTTNPVVRATIHATDIVRNGVPVDLIHAACAYSNGTLRVEDLVMVGQDGQLTGGIVYDTAAQLLSLDGRSTAPPMAIARFFGPGLERILSPYRMEGPSTIQGKGTIGLGGNSARDLRLHIRGEQFGWRSFLADRAEVNLALSDSTTAIDNVTAQWCEGDVTGSLRFEGNAATHAARHCRADLVLTGANLASVVDVFQDLKDRKAYSGTLSGQLTLSGDAGPGFMNMATGSGRVSLQDGDILCLSLFGGLSKYLSLLVPGIGYVNQRELRGTFHIRDGTLHTSDMQLLGKFVSIQAKGSYTFEGNLKFRVQVLFLEEGLTATVTRLLTSPLTRALEFELTGTTKAPRWRPTNTPDRLLKFFNEKLGSVLPLGRTPNSKASPQTERMPQ